MSNSKDPMLDMYIIETMQLMEQLEQVMLKSEKSNNIVDSLNEIFRIMHTIKGNSAMMLFDNIATLAHSVEDLFDYLRNSKVENINYSSITDMVLETIDFIKGEIISIKETGVSEGKADSLIEQLKSHLILLKESNPDLSIEKEKEKQKFYISSDNSRPFKGLIKETVVDKANIKCYKAVINFEEGCEMENVRAFTIVHNLNDIAIDISHYPEDIIENNDSADIIKKQGFIIQFSSDRKEQRIKKILSSTAFVKTVNLSIIKSAEKEQKTNSTPQMSKDKSLSTDITSSVLSVNVEKLDKLMDLIGELVVSESMVTGNPDLRGLNLENFNKASRQLKKIINDVQNVVMSMRMVPLSNTFRKMNRIVRDMCRNLNKEADLDIIGEDTEVDKNIIEHISDPLMHIIRNSMDHGIERPEERQDSGKNRRGKITLEAKNEGGDVWIIVKDDGKGMDKDRIYEKAFENGVTDKSKEELTDREIYSFIFVPGFSTNSSVTEYSGRGVGMDVVIKNIEKIRGSVYIDSFYGKGSIISIKIPLTLAIIDGMTVKVGNSRYTIPTVSIKESFRVSKDDIIVDPDGNELIYVRGTCYPIKRLHQIFNVKTDVINISDGIITMIENEDKKACIFSDALIGQHQVVIKALPKYIKKVKGIVGCTLLGDGGISLVVDVQGIIE